MCASWTRAAAALTPWYWAMRAVLLNIGVKKARLLGVKNALGHQLVLVLLAEIPDEESEAG